MVLSKRTTVLLLLLITIYCGRTTAEVYEVGDGAGWTHVAHVDYKAWAASKSFRVGDTIVFKYNKEFHNVVRVSHENYNACNATGAASTFTSGNDSFVIKRPHIHLYFVCGFPGHCEAGQKIDIRVADNGGGTPTPTSAVPSPAPVNPASPPSASPPNASPSRTASSPAPAEHKTSESAGASFSAGMLWMSILIVSSIYMTSSLVL